MKIIDILSFAEKIQDIPGRVRWKVRLGKKAVLQAQEIENQISLLSGVKKVRLNWKANSLVVEYCTHWLTTDILVKEISKLQIQPDSANSKNSAKAPSINKTMFNFTLLLASRLLPTDLAKVTTLAASTPLVLNSIDDLVKKGFTSQVLEGLAVTVSTFRNDFTAANTTLFMLSLGEYLEESIVRRSDDMLRGMLRPVSNEVWKFEGKKEKLVKLESLAVGDIILCTAGTIIPIDGTVLSGLASVDEASMTGESVGQKKERGSKVLSGTLVENGSIKIYVETVGANTAVARIADYIENSLSTKCGTQLEAMRLAEKMVPWVMALAGSTYLLSRDFKRVAAVLQADYSCVLKLIVPVAMKSAMYEAGKNNILIKGASALENLAAVDTFVFDKTGTLTEGMLEVTDVITLSDDFSKNELIALAASLEEHYVHPLANAVVLAARNIGAKHFAHSEVDYIIAHGLVSKVRNKKVVIGSKHFLEDHEKISFKNIRDEEKIAAQGHSIIYIAYNNRVIGMLVLKDKIRKNAKAVIEKLHEIGVKNIVMLTGDRQIKAREIAEKLGIDIYFAELEPEQKAEIITRLKNEGKKIAFVGDGINDGPALAGATVGIAMKNGADLARMTADVVLLEDNLELVVTCKNIANNVMKEINDDQKITFGLNTSILALASAGFLPPATTSILHNGSTIGVLLKAMYSKKNKLSPSAPVAPIRPSSESLG